MLKPLTVLAFALLLFTFAAPITIIAQQTFDPQISRITAPVHVNMVILLNSSQVQGPGSGGGGGGGI